MKQDPPSYRTLLRVPGFRALMLSGLLSRTATTMATVALVLFTLQRFHSAAIAGLSVFLLIFPGLAVSPVAGALLDRTGRRGLMALDFCLGASGMLALGALAWSGALNAALLLGVVSFVSLTSTLSAAGARSLLPHVLPRELWERGNAVDTIGYGVAAIFGPALAGGLFATAGGPLTLVVVALLDVGAAALLLAVHEPAQPPRVTAGVFREAGQGLLYVTRSSTLRWLALSIATMNIAFGLVTIALPLLVFREHGGAATVGELFALQGVLAVPSALLAGRMRTAGRERAVIAGGDLLQAGGTLLLLLPALPLLAVAMGVFGLGDGAGSVALFSLRQRRTDRAWWGRAFAVSMSLNYAGTPIGAALAGPLVAWSLNGTVLIATGLCLGAAMVTWRIPSEARHAALSGAHSRSATSPAGYDSASII